MHNCYIPAVSALSAQLMLEQISRESAFFGEKVANEMVSEAEIAKINGWMKIARQVADDFEIKSAHERISIIVKKLNKPIRQRDLAVELRVLRETIDSGFRNQLVYRYPNFENEKIRSWTSDWKAVIENFPESKTDIYLSVDLWALSHYTASVFHLMRVLEYGLKFLAEENEVSTDNDNWQNIIEKIESKIIQAKRTLPKGSDRNDKLNYMSEFAKEFSYFKDGWRNFVSHNKISYNKQECTIVLDHVRSFMTILANKSPSRLTGGGG